MIDLAHEIDSLLEGKGCTDAKMIKCKGRSGPHLEVLCRNCDERDFEPSPYVMSLYQSSVLLDAGFPITPDSFSLDYWLDLSLVRQKIRQKTFRCPIG